jgi:cell division protein FtsZ
MGQAIAEGENRAIEAVMGALDSPLLNDNDITGAQQVLLKIVTGNGDDEIKMSELFKIKNKIQEAAGRNVNIIEGIGIDAELGAAVSVTVVATGFEEKRKPKGTTIVGLDEEDVKVNEKIESSLSIEPVVDLLSNDSPQHILDLEEEEYIAPIDELMTFGIPEAVQTIPQIEEDKKIVFELNIDEEEETPEQVISSILQEEPKVEMKTVVLEMDDEQEVETLRTLDSNPKVSPDNMRVEARERENRLRAISQQLRTPSGLTNLEDIPAYKRNQIELDETSHSAENEISTYTLSDGKNNTTELKQNNSFLHDNVD